MGVAQVVFWDGLKLLVALAVLIYAALIVSAYEIEGKHYQPRFQLTKPARSGETLLIWTGVRILDVIVRASRAALNQMFAASADVGDWVVGKSSPSVQRRVRSKFL